MCPWEGASDFYRDMGYHGGILSQFSARWFPRQVSTVQHGVTGSGNSFLTGEPVTGPDVLSDDELARNQRNFGTSIGEHPWLDDWYAERNADLSKIEVPMLSAGNWGGQGLHPRGNIEAYLQASSKEKWLEMHGLEHWTHFYTDYGNNLQMKFFAHYLKGEDNGWEKSPPVHLNVRHADGRFVERDENEWPLARTQWTKYYPDFKANALVTKPLASEQTTTFDALGDGITLELPPFTTETEYTGPAKARLFVSSSTSDADLFLIVRAFDPKGGEITFQGALDPNTPIAQGWLRASHRKLDPKRSLEYRPYHTHDEHQPLTPGSVYQLDIEIWPTCLVLPKGYRISLSIRGKDYVFPGELSDFAKSFHYAHRGVGPFQHEDPKDRPRDIFGGKTTLYSGGKHESYLLMPVIPPKK
jgi:predicted acyl esterase